MCASVSFIFVSRDSRVVREAVLLTFKIIKRWYKRLLLLQFVLQDATKAFHAGK